METINTQHQALVWRYFIQTRSRFISSTLYFCAAPLFLKPDIHMSPSAQVSQELISKRETTCSEILPCHVGDADPTCSIPGTLFLHHILSLLLGRLPSHDFHGLKSGSWLCPLGKGKSTALMFTETSLWVGGTLLEAMTWCVSLGIII